MTPQQITNKIADLEQWLRDNPNHENRTIIETDLRKLYASSTDSSRGVPTRTIERDTFDLREYNFYNV